MAGVNYLFTCTGKQVVANPSTNLYAVKVFVPLKNEKAELVDIKEIDVAALI